MAAISNNSITKHELRSQLNILGKTKLEKKKCYHKEQKLFILIKMKCSWPETKGER